MKINDLFLQQGNFIFRHRSNLPLILVVAGLLVFVSNKDTQLIKEHYNFIILVSLIFSIIGIWIRFVAVGYSDSNTSGRNTAAGQVADSLNTTGLYSIFRHPLYIGNFFMWLGAAILTANFWFIIVFIMFYILYYERVIFVEENFLNNKFKERFEVWASKTNTIFPSFKNYKSSANSFDLLKAITKEKNGFTAIFILIYLFKMLHNYFFLEQNLFQFDIWFILLILSLLVYLILKIVKNNIKKTQKINTQAFDN